MFLITIKKTIGSECLRNEFFEKECERNEFKGNYLKEKVPRKLC